MVPPARTETFFSSTRLSPAAMIMIGAPLTTNTSDFAIWATSTPRASAACCDVRACTSSSMTLPLSPEATMAACTFSAAGFMDGSEGQLRHHAHGVRRPRPHDESGDAGALPRGQSLADARLRAAERDLVHEGVRHRGGGVLLLAGKVEVLDALGLALVAVAGDQLVVEVLPPRSHAAHVERELRLDPRTAGRHVVAHHHRHRGRHVEAVQRLAAPRGAKARVEV